MELDDLKAGWEKETDYQIGSGRKDISQLQFMLHNKAGDMLTRIRKRYEMIISCLLFSVMISILVHPIISDDFNYPGSASGFVKGMMLYLLVLLFYWLKLVNINNISLSDQIRERLEDMLKWQKRSLRLEAGFIVLAFVGGPLVSRFVYHGRGFTDLDDIGVRIAVPAGLILMSIILYIIIKRHRRNILELQGYLAEYTERGN